MKTQKQIENRAKWKFQSVDNSIIESKAKLLNFIGGEKFTTQEIVEGVALPYSKVISVLQSLELDKKIIRKAGKWQLL